ncbi:MAG: Nif11-like leader peptide family natural product precursor [Leptolyngbyaceae cyanobacterium]
MSTAAVQEFLRKVAEDESLQGELAQALEAENDRQAVTELANSKGYEFTPEELWAEIQRRQTEFEKFKRAGELSDEELEETAAGAIPAAIAQVALSW